MNEPFILLKNAVHPDILRLLDTEAEMLKDIAFLKHGLSGHSVPPPEQMARMFDVICDKSFKFYGQVFTDALLVNLQPMFESATGVKLIPQFSYGRIHWHGSVMRQHRDRDVAEISASLCVSSDIDSWPLIVDGTEAHILPGDIALFKGRDHDHGRNPFTGNRHVQIMFHYVDANGPFSHFKFDGRPLLGIPT